VIRNNLVIAGIFKVVKLKVTYLTLYLFIILRLVRVSQICPKSLAFDWYLQLFR